MYQLQNIDYLYRISTMTGLSKLVTVQADRDSHDLNDKHFVMLNLCRAIVNFANEGHVISAVYELEPDGTLRLPGLLLIMMTFLNALFRWMTANTGIRFTALMISSMNTTMILTMLWMLCIPSKLTVISTGTTGVLPPIKT